MHRVILVLPGYVKHTHLSSFSKPGYTCVIKSSSKSSMLGKFVPLVPEQRGLDHYSHTPPELILYRVIKSLSPPYRRKMDQLSRREGPSKPNKLPHRNHNNVTSSRCTPTSDIICTIPTTVGHVMLAKINFF